MGLQVSGSDRQASAHAAQRLAAAGARVVAQQAAANLTDLRPQELPDVVLISSAIDAANPERRAAEDAGPAGRQARRVLAGSCWPSAG